MISPGANTNVQKEVVNFSRRIKCGETGCRENGVIVKAMLHAKLFRSNHWPESTSIIKSGKGNRTPSKLCNARAGRMSSVAGIPQRAAKHAGMQVRFGRPVHPPHSKAGDLREDRW